MKVVLFVQKLTTVARGDKQCVGNIKVGKIVLRADTFAEFYLRILTGFNIFNQIWKRKKVNNNERV